MLNWLSRRRLYVRFNDREIQASCLSTGREHRDVPLVTLQVESSRRFVLAVGASSSSETEVEARSLHAPGVVTVNPFQHERIVVADFEVADALIRYVMFKLSGSTIQRRPDIIMHPTRMLVGGLADVERRALMHLAASAGAGRAAVHEGSILSPTEALSFPVEPVKGRDR
jgi:MreB/Mbl protein